MKRALALSIGVVLAAAVICSVWAQEPQYSLKDYMPLGVGSKWTMKSTGDDGQTLTHEVLKARVIGGQQALPIVAKDADGNIRSGTVELVSAEKLLLFGSMFARRGSDAGARPTTIKYEPAASFPGKMRAQQSADAKLKVTRGERQFDITIKLELAAVETVTVPKGTFEGCLKLVYTTSFGRGEMKRTVWYAKGVGMVKTERGARGDRPPTTAELTDYTLAK
ncbi:MAG: hypothetical protein ACE5JM_10505 [Armatimonadota bacterium]